MGVGTNFLPNLRGKALLQKYLLGYLCVPVETFYFFGEDCLPGIYSLTGPSVRRIKDLIVYSPVVY